MDATNRNLALTSVLAEELARSGTTDVVISPGSRSTPLAVALDRQPGLRTHMVIDERSAGFFGLGAAQATGRPVVLVCTSGTAAANYLPAIAEADASAIPLVVLTADRPPELRETGAGQTIDQLNLYGDRVRWFFDVGDPEADDDGLTYLRSLASRAFAVAAGQPRPGPVHLNMSFREPLAPTDDPGSVTASLPLATTGRPGGHPFTTWPGSGAGLDDAAVRDIESVVSNSRKPLLLAGRLAGSVDRAAAFALAETLGAPVLAEPTSQLRFGSPTLPGLIWRYDELLSTDDDGLEPDLIVRIGEMPTSKNLRQWVRSVSARIPELVIDPTWGFNDPGRRASFVIRATIRQVADALGNGLATERDYRNTWLGAQEDLPQQVDTTGAGVGTVEAFGAISSYLADGDLIYTASSMAIRNQESCLAPGSADVLFLANRGANGIDGLLASGFGAAAATGRRTLIITGDLGFQHDVGSLALCPGLDARIVVFDSGGGAIFDRLPQKKAMPPEEFERLMTTPGGMSTSAAAALFGIDHLRVESGQALASALRERGPRVIEVPCAV